MAKAKRQQQRPQSSQASQARRPSTDSAHAPQQPKQPDAQGPATGSSRLASIRAATGTTRAGQGGTKSAGRGAQPQRSRYNAPQPWWRRNLGTLVTVGGVVALVAAFIIFAQIQNQQASVGVGSPVPASVLKDVTNVPPTVSAKVGAGAALNVFQATPKGTPLLTANGKPEVIYVGAEWCPYCAATRWSTVVALSRFGSFSGLTLMKSSTADAYPNTNTFSFQKATYTSQFITFSATETADRNQNPLATPGPSATKALATYDAPPYTSQAGGIPFMSYGNQYVTTNSLYIPTMLQGLTWQQIASQLNNPNSDVTKAIVGGANMQTAAICKLTNNQPGNVCNTPTIQQLAATLPQPK